MFNRKTVPPGGPIWPPRTDNGKEQADESEQAKDDSGSKK